MAPHRRLRLARVRLAGASIREALRAGGVGFEAELAELVRLVEHQEVGGQPRVALRRFRAAAADPAGAPRSQGEDADVAVVRLVLSSVADASRAGVEVRRPRPAAAPRSLARR